MSRPTPSWWQRRKYLVNLLLLALPLYYFWQAMNPVAQPPLEQKTLGPLTATPVPLDDLEPYLHDGIYVKDFRVDFCEGCISRIRQAYLVAGPAPQAFPVEGDGVLHGSGYALHVHAAFPEETREEDRLWLMVETWDGERLQASWPLDFL